LGDGDAAETCVEEELGHLCAFPAAGLADEDEDVFGLDGVLDGGGVCPYWKAFAELEKGFAFDLQRVVRTKGMFGWSLSPVGRWVRGGLGRVWRFGNDGRFSFPLDSLALDGGMALVVEYRSHSFRHGECGDIRDRCVAEISVDMWVKNCMFMYGPTIRLLGVYHQCMVDLFSATTI
jgi:hypothetical protein